MNLKLTKRILSLALALLLCAGLFPAAEAQAANITATENYIRTSPNEDNYLAFSISGKTVTVEGVLKMDGLSGVMLVCGEKQLVCHTSAGKYFSVSCSLGTLSEPVSVDIYTATNGSNSYWSMVWQNIYVEQTDSGYRFMPSPVLENNRSFANAWLNPGDYLYGDISSAVKAMSDEIVGGETDDYRKLFLLHRWVAENIYYDYDYYYGDDYTYYDSDSILENKRSVCEGYANLLRDLVLAQNIPCMKVTTYALGVSVGGGSYAIKTEYADTRSSNHAHVEAFVDGRWVAMDPTWDSNNKYQNGEYVTKATNGFLYFDIATDMLALNHKIITRGDYDLRLDQNGTVENIGIDKEAVPSSWARAEVSEAIGRSFIPWELQSSYRSNITREEFCRTLVSMLRATFGAADNAELLACFGLSAQSGLFSDTTDADVCAANLLGVINGRGNGIFDPYSSISRQEAAAMLMRAAKVLEVEFAGDGQYKFSDDSAISPWAKESVYFVYGVGVMNGVGNNAFNPSGTYTREQAYMTVLRLYKATLAE